MGYWHPILYEKLNYIYKTSDFNKVYKIGDLIQSCQNVTVAVSSIDLWNGYKNAADVNFDRSISYNASVIWEYIAEEIRKNDHKELPSRLDSYFLFANRKSAESHENEPFVKILE